MDHVAHCGDFGHSDDVAGAGGSGALGDVPDVVQGEGCCCHGVGGGRQEVAAVQLEPPHRQQDVQWIVSDGQSDGVMVGLR